MSAQPSLGSRFFVVDRDADPAIHLCREGAFTTLLSCGRDHPDADMLRRLAACWNACEHVPIEVLEAHASGGLPWSVGDQIDQRVMHANVVRMNHELREALQSCERGLAALFAEQPGLESLLAGCTTLGNARIHALAALAKAGIQAPGAGHGGTE